MPIYRIVCTYTPTYKCMCVCVRVYICIYVYIYIYTHTNTIGFRFTTGLRSRIFGCKSNRRKTVLFKWFKLR